jgi:hypothetical protein
VDQDIDFSHWEQFPHPFVVVDEVRMSRSPQPGEFVVFVFFLIDSAVAVSLLRAAEKMRERVPVALHDRPFKGSDIFAYQMTRKAYQPAEDYVFEAIAKAQQIYALSSSNIAITETFREIKGNIISGKETDTTKTLLQARELMPFLAAVRAVAELIGSKQGQRLTVLVDRSRQLGLDPHTRSIHSDQFEVFSGTLYAGEPTITLISVSDTTPRVQDLLLVPDAIGYLLRKHRGSIQFSLSKIESGERFWFCDIRASLLTELREVLKREQS